MGGTFRLIERPARIDTAELFDQDWTGGETFIVTRFTEQGGRYDVTLTIALQLEGGARRGRRHRHDRRHGDGLPAPRRDVRRRRDRLAGPACPTRTRIDAGAPCRRPEELVCDFIGLTAHRKEIHDDNAGDRYFHSFAQHPAQRRRSRCRLRCRRGALHRDRRHLPRTGRVSAGRPADGRRPLRAGSGVPDAVHRRGRLHHRPAGAAPSDGPCRRPGAIGIVAGAAGAVAMWQLGDQWYPIALVLLALPSTWLGGWLFGRRH